MAAIAKILIAGSSSLKEIANAIRYQEAFGWKFSACRIVSREGTRMNEVSFAEHDGVAPAFRLQGAASPEPQGLKREWRGPMRYNAMDRLAALYR